MDKEHKDYEMSHKEWKMFNRQKKIEKSLTLCRYYCSCGHSVTITPKQDRAMCDWCKRWVYSDPVEQQKHDAITREREKLMNFKKEMRRYL